MHRGEQGKSLDVKVGAFPFSWDHQLLTKDLERLQLLLTGRQASESLTVRAASLVV